MSELVKGKDLETEQDQLRVLLTLIQSRLPPVQLAALLAAEQGVSYWVAMCPELSERFQLLWSGAARSVTEKLLRHLEQGIVKHDTALQILHLQQHLVWELVPRCGNLSIFADGLGEVRSRQEKEAMP